MVVNQQYTDGRSGHYLSHGYAPYCAFRSYSRRLGRIKPFVRGTVTWTDVPAPGELRISSAAPMLSARFPIPRMPKFAESWPEGKPRPSSSINNCQAVDWWRSEITIFDASACRTALAMASWPMR